MKVSANGIAVLRYNMLSDTDAENHYNPYLKLIEIEKNSSQCGFHLTRGKWDPYPWVSEVDEGTAAFSAGIKQGDCLLEVNGEDVVGKRISEIAGLVKSKADQVSLLLWNAGVDSHCTPEALCCGPLPRNLQRLSACMSTILTFLECPVCLDTIPPPTYQCENGHLICIRCRTKSERCPVCRLRLHRGRSLISDQIYNSLIDAFNLRDESEETRATRMQQIFKHRKKENIPDIKITQSYTNKFLAKIIGKSSSVDNLSANVNLRVNNGENIFTKAKSLSTNEIFLADSPIGSRSGSISRINRKDLNINYRKPASYHGSYESLERRVELAVPENGDSPPQKDEDRYHCPFTNSCTTLTKGNEMFEHFKVTHSENRPLIQYFRPHVRYLFNDLVGQQEICHLVLDEGNAFFLKTAFLENDNTGEDKIALAQDILIWVWYLGKKNAAKNYEVNVEIRSKDSEDILLSVRSSVFSLSAMSSKEILGSKKGVFLSSRSLESLGFYTEKVLLDVKISKNDN